MLVLFVEYIFLTTFYGLYFNHQLHITLNNFFKFLLVCVCQLQGGICIEIKLLNQSDLRPRSEPTLELHSRAASSVGVMYRSSVPNTGSNSGGGRIKKTFVIMASLDLSGDFDVVNINLLTKRLKIIGLLSDIVFNFIHYF